MQSMQKMLIGGLAALSLTPGVVWATDADMHDVCTRLEAAIELQIEALEDIRDASTAAAALPEIREALSAQKALFGVDETELWNYIDRTEQVKVMLMRALQRLAAEVDRISKSDYYGSAELKGLLL